MKTTIRRALGSLTAATVLIALIAGCETNSDVESSDATSAASGVLAISPTAATVTNSVTFTASGGSGTYTWSLVETNLGTLSASGPWAVYTAKASTSTNFSSQNIVIVIDDKGNSASATVTQN